MEATTINYDYTLGDVLLKLEDVSLTVETHDGPKTLIHDINLEEKDVIRPGIKQGQMIGIVGDSGRGKSTFFKVFSGLVKPTTGYIMIPDGKGGGKEVREGDVGMVDQKYTLFRDMTIFNALMFAAKKGGIPKAERKPLVERYLHDWKLGEVIHSYPCDCSGGQRQRAAIVQQLLCQKTFIILDEPTSGLSVRGINDLKEAINLYCSYGELNTFIFATHDLNFAVELADQIYVIGYPKNEDGMPIKSGTIVASYDLKQMGLAWRPFGQGHLDLVRQVSQDIINS
ncbi:MAG: ATP-binding cassette domain-containing protein [Candidatus Peribacteria bacterium]|jgi:polar amino acid transport system ATP-binding protein|nr:ATP-binding cassette domain-containing protein [Candidatus Peribacteria bacterium]